MIKRRTPFSLSLYLDIYNKDRGTKARERELQFLYSQVSMSDLVEGVILIIIIILFLSLGIDWYKMNLLCYAVVILLMRSYSIGLC